MIRPPGGFRAAFSERSDGDLRDDATRSAFASQLGRPDRWATVTQVHGNRVLRAEEPGDHGEGDALWTDRPGILLAVLTADCLGVVVEAEEAVGVAHAGWRGAASGVVSNLAETMMRSGHPPVRIAIGPGIGPCCFEVGPEVAERFPDRVSETSWGTVSVDLRSHVAGQIDAPAWIAENCTMHDPGFFSHRADGAKQRLATVGWV